MTKTKTAREMLAKIEKDFFKGTDLAAASLLEGDERRAFRLSQVERLLTATLGNAPLAMWLSDWFWTADEGRMLMDESSPLMTPEGLRTLTDGERSRVRLIKEVAGLCHDLSLHFMFDLKEAFGVRNNFWDSYNHQVEPVVREVWEMAELSLPKLKIQTIGMLSMEWLEQQDEKRGLGNNSIQLPQGLDTPRARDAFAKAMEKQYMETADDGKYRWKGTGDKPSRCITPRESNAGVRLSMIFLGKATLRNKLF